MFSMECSKMSATPCSVYHTVQSAFGAYDLSVLKGCLADVRKKFNAISESMLSSRWTP